MTEGKWLVGNPSSSAQLAALWTGSAGVLILGLQPVLLGALLEDKRVNFDQLALAATLELLAIGIGSAVAAFVVTSSRLRLKAAALLVLAALFDYLTATAASPYMIALWRGLAGVVEGGLVAFAVELIARARYPGRYGGYFVTLQTMAQSILVAFLALFVIEEYGSRGGFMVLAFVSLASVGATFFMPRDYGVLPKPVDSGNSGVLRLQPLLALASIFFLYMFLGSLWAFLEPLATAAGMSVRAAALLVSFSLAAQVAGASLATMIEARLNHKIVLFGAGLFAAAVAAGIAGLPPVHIFWVLTMAAAFTCLFVVPFQIRLAIDADDERAAALLVPAGQLCGLALGPAFASAFIMEDNATPVAWFAAAAALVSAVLVAIFFVTQRASRRAKGRAV